MAAMFSKRTHVANGYHEDIWVRVVTDQTVANNLVLSFKLPANSSMDTKKTYVTEFCHKEQYTKVGPGFAPNFYTSVSLDATVYVSIIFAKPETDFACENHPVQVNRSVIIDRNGSLKMARYEHGPDGKSSIWEDREGIWHKPA